MGSFSISIYRFFRRNRLLFWTLLTASVFILAFMASRIKIEENLTAFYPKTEGGENVTDVFTNMKTSNRFIVMFSDRDSSSADIDTLLCAADRFKEICTGEGAKGLVESCESSFGSSQAGELTSFVTANLPIFLDSALFAALDSLTSPEAIASRLARDKRTLLSPIGFATKDAVMADPLGLSSGVLGKTAELSVDSDYKLDYGHVFTSDGKTLLVFVEPSAKSGDMGRNDEVVTFVESALDSLSAEYPGIETTYFGGPAVAVYNSRQIKKDTLLTSIIALLVITIFILMVFKQKRSIFLILLPVAYGSLFGLAVIAMVKGSVSGIAVGASSAIMGIALSYSIHMLAHLNHVTSIEQLLEDLAGSMTVGAFTTIGAFFGLLFTSSNLLHDFGLFASFMLAGTTIFCLVFLPQLLRARPDVKEGRILRAIDSFSSIHFEKKKLLVLFLSILFIVCCFNCGRVGFDSDMSKLNWWEPKLKAAEERLEASSDKDYKNVLFVSVGTNSDEAAAQYAKTNALLSSLMEEGRLESWSNASAFAVGETEQRRRIERWKAYWSDAKAEEVASELREAGRAEGFRPDAFDSFIALLTKDYRPLDLFAEGAVPEALGTFFSRSEKNDMLVSQARIPVADRESIYALFGADKNLVVFDQGWFVNKAASTINDDFNFILWFSSLLIFIVLCVSYGRLELALLSFLPMAISWIIITGSMAILGIKFNIVSIILSTFIFGMGDDFSIFILDGLLSRYKSGKDLLPSHKSAIFFSTFTLIVGIGVLIFAKHPALHSLAVMTILGMLAVVLSGYIVEPLIFWWMAFRPLEKGMPPFTITTLLADLVGFGTYVVASILTALFLILLLPFGRKVREEGGARLAHILSKGIKAAFFWVGTVRLGETPDKKKPAIYIANHQSSIDIVEFLSEHPKIKLMTAHWVQNYPVYGQVIRLIGYYDKSKGIEAQMEKIRKDLENGWSVLIFPEGTRSQDGSIGRFHKGAFYLSMATGFPVRPAVTYGNCLVMPKAMPANVGRGTVALKYLPEILPTQFSTYQEFAKYAEALFKSEHAALKARFTSPENSWFRFALCRNYIYKGPVVEWYVRVKTAMEHDYSFFNEVIPSDARVTDLGCGMGQLDFMLSLYSPDRRVHGIDYDADKIAIASHGWLMARCPRLSFEEADAMSAELPESDVFVISDMLHYLKPEDQQTLIRRCAERLAEGGMILLRDGNDEDKAGQKMTDFTEVLSTKIFRFNKTVGALSFTGESELRHLASSCGLSFSHRASDKLTSNTFFILRKS